MVDGNGRREERRAVSAKLLWGRGGREKGEERKERWESERRKSLSR